MASHPYISGAGNITQAIGLLRKNFPATITSETIKKYGLASNNESYVINALQFIGVIDEEGKRTARGAQIFTLHKEEEFQKAFEGLIRDAYKDLFELRGDDSWALDKEDLIGYFRTTDKTSEAIGTRQAGVFRVFAALAGHDDGNASTKAKGAVKPKEKTARIPKAANVKNKPAPMEINVGEAPKINPAPSRDMALTVRIEINLPADGTRETYDNIFQSIRANLLNE